MEISVTTQQAVEIDSAITQILNLEIPVQLALTLSNIQSELGASVKNYATARNKLLEQYGEQNKDNPQQYTLSDAHAFEAAHNELLNTDVVFSISKKISINALDNVKGVKGNWVKAIIPIIEM